VAGGAYLELCEVAAKAGLCPELLLGGVGGPYRPILKLRVTERANRRIVGEAYLAGKGLDHAARQVLDKLARAGT
jgi:hypothetical protein